MGKALIITEKPSVARDIVAAVGGFVPVASLPQGVSVWESDQYICTHALGHLLELYGPEDYKAELKQWRLQDLPVVPEAFLLKPKSQTAQLLRILRQQVARPDVTEIINACDAAREGELIFREIIQHSLCDKPCTRMWLQSLTPEAIRSALNARQPGHNFQGLANAAFGRAQADWLIGMNLSRAATLKLARASEGGVWSVGRVQTPTLAMLVDREFAILSHDPKPFQWIKSKFKALDHEYEATWIDPSIKSSEQDPTVRRDRLFDSDKARQIKDSLQAGVTATASDVLKTREQKAPMLFSLTALQRYMASRHKWTAKRTLDIAQKCYEQHKVITYPRTESDALPTDYKEKIKGIFESLQKITPYDTLANQLVTNEWHNESSIFDDSAVSDHFAIIPTGRFPSSLPKDEGVLFDVVIRRLLASLMPPAVIDQVERTTVVAGQTFISGPEEIIRQPGWQQAYDSETNSRGPKTQRLKPISPKSAVTLMECAIVEEATKPPYRIREAELLSLMEHAGRHVDDPEMARILRKAGGIGTAATRAEIIENLKQKDYVFANLQPTVKGMHLIRVLKLARAENLTSPLLTAQLEQHLNQVESGASSRSSFISQTARSVESSLQSMMQFDLERTFDFAPPLGDCPRCAKGQSETRARTVHERMWNYSCISNKDGDHPCGFILPKDCDGRWLDPRTVSKLLTDHALEQGLTIDDFPADDKNRNSSKRRLKIASGSLEVLSETGQPMEAALHLNHSKSSARRRVTWGTCPIHHNDACLIVETKNAFICETKLRHLREGNLSAVGFQLPKAICDQRLKFDDIQAFIRDGKTRVIEGFKSKGGKLFDAAVVRNPAGSWDFEFRGR